MSILVTGSHGCIGTWVLKTLVEAGEQPIAYDLSVTYDPATTVPVADAYDDGGFQRDLGPLPRTRLREGVRQTVERFERLLRAGRLDIRELA